MKITRITDTRDTPEPNADRQWWSVDLEDGGRPGLAWVSASALAADEDVLRELNRQKIVLHHAFTARVRSLSGIELRPERVSEHLSA